MQKVIAFVKKARKFIIAAVGVAVTLNIDPGTVQDIIAVLTAAGVYRVPNDA